MFITFAVISLVIIGFLVFSGKISRFGRLPGDVRYQGEHTRVFAPLTSMLLLSLLLSLILTLVSWLF